jgi:predicted DNA-binding ribbon-helix-helix protein
MARPVKRSVTLAGHRTSLSLEPEFWDALQEIARLEKASIASLISRIDRGRSAAESEHEGGLSGAVRVFILNHFREMTGKS